MMRQLFSGFAVSLVLLAGVSSVSEARAEDTRIPVILNEPEHEFVVAEMRGFVESLQLIMSGLATGDMETVADAAKTSGMFTANRAPDTLGAKFPETFAVLGGETHQLWDQLAAEAEDMGDRLEIQRQLGVMMNNCVACHASYRLVKEKVEQ